MELNTTGIDKFLVYLHAKDHFVPYESGTRLAMHPTKISKSPKYNKAFTHRFGGLQLRLMSQLMSTAFTYTRNDDFSLGRSEIVRLDREENRCDDKEEPINLENCYRAYSEDQVNSQGMEYIIVEVIVINI